MKQYILKQIGDNEPIGKYSNKADAVDDMDTIIADHNEDLDSDDDGFLTPFDFTLEVVECQDVNETITNFDEARAFLGGKPNNDYTISKKVLSGNFAQVVNSNLPDSFTIQMPIFKGMPAETIEVETFAQVNGREVAFVLLSPGAQAILEDLRDKVIDDEIAKIKDIAPEIAIIEI